MFCKILSILLYLTNHFLAPEACQEKILIFEVMFQLNTSEASCGIPTFVGEKLSMGVSALVFFFLLPLIAMAWENDFQKAKAYYSFIIVSLVLWVI